MGIRIHCDACAGSLEKGDAIVVELDDGELAYFCSQECAEAERLDPDAEGPSENRERAAGS